MLAAEWGYFDGSKGGRPPHDPAVMIMVMILPPRTTSATSEWNCRASCIFLGLGPGDRTPDEQDPLFRGQLTRALAIEKLFEEFDGPFKGSG
ncbi:hypothetical protein [Sphingobium sp. ZW T5_29]|uniref:hypothetical protein n=1 Tax=Sphingobium sp. ZW T5_29 TaxID=3378077 RepID=UPI0038525CBB